VAVGTVYDTLRDVDPVEGGEDVLAVILKHDTQRSLRNSNLDTARAEIMKLKKHTLAVGTIEPDAVELLNRHRRGKRAFGARVEDKMLCCSVRGLLSAHCGRMKYLSADTFFNKWPVPLQLVPTLPQMTATQYEKMYEADHEDIQKADLGEEDAFELTDIAEGNVIPYPHEHHYVLMQEMLHTFKAEILVDLAPGSGQKVLGCLLSNCKAVVVCKNQVHLKFVQKNLGGVGEGTPHDTRVCPSGEAS